MNTNAESAHPPPQPPYLPFFHLPPPPPIKKHRGNSSTMKSGENSSDQLVVTPAPHLSFSVQTAPALVSVRQLSGAFSPRCCPRSAA